MSESGPTRSELERAVAFWRWRAEKLEGFLMQAHGLVGDAYPEEPEMCEACGEYIFEDDPVCDQEGDDVWYWHRRDCSRPNGRQNQ